MTESTLLAFIPGARNVLGAGPLVRHRIDATTWESIAARLATESGWALTDLWSDGTEVHMAIAEPAARTLAIVSLPCREGHYPSVARHHVPAARLERALHDLHGFSAVATPDDRPWLDHGRWPSSRAESAYRFLDAEGESLHQIPVGPVHAGIIEPGHFRFTASGETIVRLEARLGYVHKGIDALLRRADVDTAARIAARTSGDSTVAYGFAFARAVEAACGAAVPARATRLRAVMAELERIANHLGDFGAICNDASFALLHAHCGILRERVLRAAGIAFGHRLMMDAIVPGGVAHDVDAAGVEAIRAAVRVVKAELPALVDLYDNTTSLQDRTAGTGILVSALAQRFGAGGYVGRASGRGVDARTHFPYAPYDALEVPVPVLQAGDVNARVWIRIEEIRASLVLVTRLLDEPPEGEVRVAVNALAMTPREGAALVEGFRGDVFAWVRLAADGRIECARLRDPSWFQWPLLEAVVEGNIVADFPLCNKSFNCSYSGHDL
jgi:Ni,Fe-hydrogenase III large subunit